MVCGCRLDREAMNAAVPAGRICGLVFVPRELVVPHSNHTPTELSAGVKVAFKTTELDVTLVASFVTTDELLVCE
jgi:hypothetical protein